MVKSSFFLLQINDHVKCFNKIQSTLDGTGDFQGRLPTVCPFGQWYYNEGRAEMEAAGSEFVEYFDQIAAPHEAFHHHSLKALELKRAGDDAGAFAEFTEMQKAFIQFEKLLMKLDSSSGK
jgi:hypothetical protein